MRTIDSVTGPAPSVARLPIVRWYGSESRKELDVLAAEEPLEIRFAGCSVAVTMRTPGDDVDLALGFLYTEGIIRCPGDVATIAHCQDLNAGETASNIINVNPVSPDLVDPERWQRNFFASSSCGICGKASIEAVRQDREPLTSDVHVSHQMLYLLDRQLRESQTVFSSTGGLHAAALFDVQGGMMVLREDVGRHNATDKVIGHVLRQGTTQLHHHLLMVSGRASFEIVQKALVAGIPVIAAVSAPSSLAVDLAREGGITLIGFLRSECQGGNARFNVYTHPDRIV